MVKVISHDGETKLFEILAGVLQGDTLASYLFIIITLDYLLRKAVCGGEEELGFTIRSRQTSRIAPKMVTDLDFADDIGLISNTREQAHTLLEEVQKLHSKLDYI